MKARNWAFFRLIAGLGIAWLAAGCAGGPLVTAAPDETVAPDTTPDSSDTPSLVYSGSGDVPKSCGSTTLAVEPPGYTTAELAAKGWNFVVADVVGAEPAIYNTPDGKRPAAFSGRPTGTPDVGARPAVYTPIDIDVVSSVKGSLDAGPAKVLVLGGRVDCFTMWVSPMPSIEKGSRYVFVLGQALAADGKQSLASQEVSFAWPVDEKGVVTTDDGLISLDELTKVVEGGAAAAP